MGNIPGKPFTDTLGELDGGQLHRDLTQAVYDIIAAVMDTRKAGGITLQIAFAATGRGTVEVAGKFKATIPEHDRNSTTFFVGKDGSLQRRDPNQHELPLREVEMPNNAPVRVQS